MRLASFAMLRLRIECWRGCLSPTELLWLHLALGASWRLQRRSNPALADATAQRTRRVTATDLAKLAGFIQAAVSLWIIGKQVGRLTLEWQKLIVDDRR